MIQLLKMMNFHGFLMFLVCLPAILCTWSDDHPSGYRFSSEPVVCQVPVDMPQIAPSSVPMGRTVRRSLGRGGSGAPPTNWKISLLLMGKSTISTGPFSIAMLNY